MNGILLVKKEQGPTSRDIVNKVCKILNTKKVGHTGTLDPLATGLLVLCIGSSLKLVELLTNHDKEYIAKIRLGIETDTLDITGKITNKNKVPKISNEDLQKVLNSLTGKIKQQVPKYSAIKVNGKKLYEYARNNQQVELPIREIEVYNIEIISPLKDNEFTIKCNVSKGTYIRSLVRDIGYKLNTFATLIELNRTKLGNFSLEESYSIEDIEKGNFKLLSPLDILPFPQITVDKEMEKKIRNGQILPKFFEGEKAFILNKQGNLLAIYTTKDIELVKPYKMFISE